MAENPYQSTPGYQPAGHGSPRDPADPFGITQSQPHGAEFEVLRQRGANGANWFYWIAALSLINSVILHTGGDMFFVVGMGVTALADRIAMAAMAENPELESGIRMIALGFAGFTALVVAGFGWLSRKGWLSVFAIGIVLYVLDGLLFVLFEDWMSVGFHAFALFWMINGFLAFRQIRAMEASY